MKKILVTGGNGFLGSNLIRTLLHRNYKVRAFLLPGAPCHTIVDLPIEIVRGDVLQPAAIRQAVAGCEQVIHLAALPWVWPTRSAKVRQVNIEGTRHVIDACLEESVGRLIYVSTAAVFPFGTKERPGVEAPLRTPFLYDLDYIFSKWKAQQLVLQSVKRAGLRAVVVNPTYMLGPYDPGSGSNQLIRKVDAGRLPAFPKGGKNFVHVADVAEAMANALTKGRIGECYILGHENLSYREVLGKIAYLLQAPSPKVQVPGWIMKSLGWCTSQLAQMFPLQPAFNYSTARIACDKQYYSAQKAVAELDMPQTPIDQAILGAIWWYRKIGLIKVSAHEKSVWESSLDNRFQHGDRQTIGLAARSKGRAAGAQRPKS